MKPAHTKIPDCRSLPHLVIVIPCYNEEDILPVTLNTILSFLHNCTNDGIIRSDSSVLCVDDGSRDNTWSIISSHSLSNEHIEGIKLSKNSGHQTALMAGISAAKDCDIVVSIDADLQDDISVIRDMIAAWRAGSDIVYGVRDKRQTDTFFKRNTALAFYSLMQIMGVNLIKNHADFRLMDRAALNALLEYKERNLFLRGIVPLIGFSSSCIYYARLERSAGESKYPLSRMISLATEGITSLSVTPLRAIAAAGVFISGFSVLAICYALLMRAAGETVAGWASVTIAIFFMGGVQMLSLGIIGEYIGKIYLETKGRPLFHTEKTTWSPADNDK